MSTAKDRALQPGESEVPVSTSREGANYFSGHSEGSPTASEGISTSATTAMRKATAVGPSAVYKLSYMEDVA